MFFLSWNGKPMPKPQGRKLFLPVNHKAFRLEDAVLSARKSPFFSLVSPKGTLLAFLHALKQEGTEEARGYLSSAISGADLEEIKGSACVPYPLRRQEKRKSFPLEWWQSLTTLANGKSIVSKRSSLWNIRHCYRKAVKKWA